MSGWTVVTLRGKEAKDYEYTRDENHDRWDATADITATAEDDDRVRRWTTWNSHVYLYLNGSRYDWERAEDLFEEYGAMVDDAVVLGANDTTDTGCARYYPRPDLGKWTDQYEESQSLDGYYVGELALCVINSRHGIVARDPFHNESGLLDERYLDMGQPHAEDPDA